MWEYPMAIQTFQTYFGRFRFIYFLTPHPTSLSSFSLKFVPSKIRLNGPNRQQIPCVVLYRHPKIPPHFDTLKRNIAITPSKSNLSSLCCIWTFRPLAVIGFALLNVIFNFWWEFSLLLFLKQMFTFADKKSLPLASVFNHFHYV